MWPHQLCPQIGTWRVPKTCKEPILEGVPYHYGYLVSLSPGAMPMPFPALLLPSQPPVDLVLVEFSAWPSGHLQFWQHGVCPKALHLRGGGGRGSSIPKSWTYQHAASSDFFWPATETFAKMVSDWAGMWWIAKMWPSKWASLTRMNEAPKKHWAWSNRPRHSSSAITLFLCSSHSVAMAFSPWSCWEPKQTPLASRVVDVICGSLGSNGTHELTIITLAGYCGFIWETATQTTLFYSQLMEPS